MHEPTMVSDTKKLLNSSKVLEDVEPKEYLLEDENVEVAYSVKYITVNEKSNKVKPPADRKGCFIVSDRRVLILLGSTGENSGISIPLNMIENAKFKSPGLTSPAIRVHAGKRVFRAILPRSFATLKLRKSIQAAKIDDHLIKTEGVGQDGLILKIFRHRPARDDFPKIEYSQEEISEMEEPKVVVPDSEPPPDSSKSEFAGFLNDMSPYEFEQFIADVWEGEGYSTTVRKGSGDRGVDVEAEKTEPFDEKHLIQAKQYSPGNKVGSEEIRSYATLYQQIPDADTVVMVTTSGFTEEALKLGKELRVKTIGLNGLFEMVKEGDYVPGDD